VVVFLLDGMLGRLARWLRLMGYSAQYYPDLEDEELLERASSGAVLVTRDVELHRRAQKQGADSYLVSSSNHLDQLEEVSKAFHLAPRPQSRCTRCNGELREATREEVAGKVPPASFKRYRVFWVCRECGKVYWAGSHWGQIKKVLQGINP